MFFQLNQLSSSQFIGSKSYNYFVYGRVEISDLKPKFKGLMVGGDGATQPIWRVGDTEEFFGSPNRLTTLQSLEQRLKMEEAMPKMTCRRGSDSKQSSRR